VNVEIEIVDQVDDILAKNITRRGRAICDPRVRTIDPCFESVRTPDQEASD